MKYYFLIMFFLISFPGYAERSKVTIYVDDAYKPFSFKENNKAKGMYIDVLRTAFSRMQDFSVKISAVPWKRGKQIMKEGKGFGLAPAFFHGHDWPYLYPYSLPFYTETIMAVCRDDILKSPRPNWPEDYQGLTIGNVAGFDGWGGDKFRQLIKEGKIRYNEVKGTTSNILKLGANRVDCIMMENKAFDYEFSKLKQSGQYGKSMSPIQKGAVIGTDPVYIGYSKIAREKNSIPYQFKFMQSFDSIIYQMNKSGEITQIMNSYNE